MASVVNKLWNMISMNNAEEADEEYDEAEDQEEYEDQEVEETKGLFGRKNNKVVNMQSTVRMVILQPTTFDQASEICGLLKEKKSVIVNLEYVNKDVARRIIDVVSGAAFALDGYMKKVSGSIILVAPYNYDITDDKDETKSSKLPPVSWLKNNINN